MCCCNNRERHVSTVVLLVLAVLLSLGAAIPMFMITYPGDECILFVSVRGESLVYGHPAGCHFISYSHVFVVIPSAIIISVLFFCYTTRNGPKDTGSLSNRSIRGSLPGLSQNSYGIQSGVSSNLLILVIIATIFVIITTIVNLSGYLVTCSQLQYENRRNVYGKSTLGIPVKDWENDCYGLFRIPDYHTRFHFDHYEYSGQWRGQYKGYEHGRPHQWTSHDHLIDIALGLELSLAFTFLSSIVWVCLATVLLLLRRSIKDKNRKAITESIEDAQIWASDMATLNNMPMRSLSPASVIHSNPDTVSQTKSIQSRQAALGLYSRSKQEQEILAKKQPGPGPGMDDLISHQQVIASTHPDGSMFMTRTGQYVQLLNGVLTNISPPPSTTGSVQYAEVQFQQQQMLPPGQQMLPPGQQMLPPGQQMAPPFQQPPSSMTQPAMMSQHNQGPPSLERVNQPLLPQAHSQVTQKQMSQSPHGSMNSGSSGSGSANNNVSHSQTGSGSNRLAQSGQSHGEEQKVEDEGKTTRKDQRKQLDIAQKAGIKCSQF